MHICTQGPNVLLTFMGSHSAGCTTCNAWSPGMRARARVQCALCDVCWLWWGGWFNMCAHASLSSDHTKPPAGAGVLRNALLRKAPREPNLLTR
jgi:hypothetical protein